VGDLGSTVRISKIYFLFSILTRYAGDFQGKELMERENMVPQGEQRAYQHIRVSKWEVLARHHTSYVFFIQCSYLPFLDNNFICSLLSEMPSRKSLGNRGLNYLNMKMHISNMHYDGNAMLSEVVLKFLVDFYDT